MDRVGLQSLIKKKKKKKSTYVRTVHFSRYALQRCVYKPRGNTSFFFKKNQKSKINNVRAPKENQTVLSWMEM